MGRPNQTELNLEIFVDTNFKLLYYINKEHYISQKSSKVEKNIIYNTFPIFITNLKDSCIGLPTYRDIGYMVRQVKTKNGKWIDIEISKNYKCSTDGNLDYIKPKQIFIAKLLRYTGSVKREFRLKFQRYETTVYSNVFTDYVDEEKLSKLLRKIESYN
jgi:hypothetical protein